MKIKKFTAPSMKEALEKVKAELGNDAIILNTRSNRGGGVLDFMKYAQFEVTAAYDEVAPSKPKVEQRPEPPTLPPPSRDNGGTYAVQRSTPPPAPDRRLMDVRVRELNDRVEIDQVMDDIKELKRSLKTLADTVSVGEMSGLPRYLAALLSQLRAAEFEDKIAKALTRQLLNELTGTELNDPRLIRDRVVDLLLEPIGEVVPVTLSGTRPRIVAFVGPTGTGKTTTIAKLATEFSLNQGCKVSVLTIDTKRIDAVGQLKSYCRIIDIPLHIAYSPDEVSDIMPRLMDSDLTLIDTPGAGPLDQDMMVEIVEFLQRLAPHEVHLTMSVTTSLNEMKRISKHFGTLKPNRVLFTKLDETETYGSMFSFAVMSKKPLSYVTFGQNVPGDFSPADPEKLLRRNLPLTTGEL